jgi:hypothetical protein
MSVVSQSDDITDAESPFDSSANADIIIRSSDRVDFFTLKNILRSASPVFNDMFSLDLAEARDQNLSNARNGLPIVQLEEDSATLHDLLLLIYPHSDATKPFVEVETYVKVGQAARKYAMDEVLLKLGSMAARYKAMMRWWPVRAFAVGVHFNWTEVIREAALNTLYISLPDFDGCPNELGLITGEDYHALLQWRDNCQFSVVFALSQLQNQNSNSFKREDELTLSDMAGPVLKRCEERGLESAISLVGHFQQVFGSKSHSAGKVEDMSKDIKIIKEQIDKTVSGVRSGQIILPLVCTC